MSKIQFHCNEKFAGFLPNPMPSIRLVPDFYRSIKPQINSNPQSSTVKRCVPFLDALSAGFIIPLWCDLFITVFEGEVNIDYPEAFEMDATISNHSIDQMPKHPYANGTASDLLLKFINPWIIKTDDGVSCLFTSPLNHLERRFKVLDGIVDTDSYYNMVNFPFIWTGGDGEFHLKKGIPLMQVIPFQRQEYNLEIGITDNEQHRLVKGELSLTMKDAYRDGFWHKRKEKPSLNEMIED